MVSSGVPLSRIDVMRIATKASDAHDDRDARILEAVDANDRTQHVGRVAADLGRFDDGGFVFGLLNRGWAELLAGFRDPRSQRLTSGPLHRRSPAHRDGAVRAMLE